MVMVVGRQVDLVEYLVDMSVFSEANKEEEEIKAFEYAAGYRNDDLVERYRAKLISWLQVAGMKLGLEDVAASLCDQLIYSGSVSREDLGWLNLKLEKVGLKHLMMPEDLWDKAYRLGLIY